jgi:hypothetical protein
MRPNTHLDQVSRFAGGAVALKLNVAKIFRRIYVAQNPGVVDLQPRHTLRHQQRARAGVAVECHQGVPMLDAEADRMTALSLIKRCDQRSAAVERARC